MESTESPKVAITHLAIGKGSQVTHHVTAMEKQNALIKYFISYEWLSAWFHKFQCIKTYFKNSVKI